MIKKILCICVLAVIAFVHFGCGTSKYADVKAFMTDVQDANEQYISALEKSRSADDISNAIEKMAEKMDEFVPLANTLLKKYPELNGMNIHKHPAELDDVFERQKLIMEKMQNASTNMRKYMTNSKVMKSFQKMATSASRLQGFM